MFLLRRGCYLCNNVDRFPPRSPAILPFEAKRPLLSPRRLTSVPHPGASTMRTNDGLLMPCSWQPVISNLTPSAVPTGNCEADGCFHHTLQALPTTRGSVGKSSPIRRIESPLAATANNPHTLSLSTLPVTFKHCGERPGQGSFQTITDAGVWKNRLTPSLIPLIM